MALVDIKSPKCDGRKSGKSEIGCSDQKEAREREKKDIASFSKAANKLGSSTHPYYSPIQTELSLAAFPRSAMLSLLTV